MQPDLDPQPNRHNDHDCHSGNEKDIQGALGPEAAQIAEMLGQGGNVKAPHTEQDIELGTVLQSPQQHEGERTNHIDGIVEEPP